jgi:hypothetical protein
MEPVNGREQYLLPRARDCLRDAIANPGGELRVIGPFGPFSLDVGVIERHERANVQLRGRQAGNLVCEIEARWAHRRRRRAHQRFQFRNEPGRRFIVGAHIRDERRRALQPLARAQSGEHELRAPVDAGAILLLDQDRGYATPGGRVPLVPAAVVYDLVTGDPTVRPGPAEGEAACEADCCCSR